MSAVYQWKGHRSPADIATLLKVLATEYPQCASLIDTCIECLVGADDVDAVLNKMKKGGRFGPVGGGAAAGCCLLKCAARGGNLRIMAMLLEEGAPIDDRTTEATVEGIELAHDLCLV